MPGRSSGNADCLIAEAGLPWERRESRSLDGLPWQFQHHPTRWMRHLFSSGGTVYVISGAAQKGISEVLRALMAEIRMTGVEEEESGPWQP